MLDIIGLYCLYVCMHSILLLETGRFLSASSTAVNLDGRVTCHVANALAPCCRLHLRGYVTAMAVLNQACMCMCVGLSSALSTVKEC